MGKGKKTTKKRDDDDWEDDLQEIAKEAGIDLNHEEDVYEAPTAKKEKKKKKKQDSLAENNEDIMDKDDIVKAKPSFQALMLEEGSGGEGSEASGADSEEEAVVIETITTKPSKQTKKSKDKKKGKNTQAADEDDIDAICAEFELNNVSSDQAKGKKSKKKSRRADADVEELVENVEELKLNEDEECMEHDDELKNAPTETVGSEETTQANIASDASDEEDGGPKIKTAAQKKAEKKERENKKKEARRVQKQREKEKQSKDDVGVDAVTDNLVEGQASEKQDGKDVEVNATDKDATKGKMAVDAAADAGAVVSSGNEEEEGESVSASKDKKKKKKKKKKEEEEKKKPKKVNKAAIKQMQEALEKTKQEEERLRLEEEASAKAFEEAEDRRLEKIRLEQEKKERKKQKDKEKKERLRKEGKLLTPAQREQKRRAEMMLEAMRQQGIQVPTKDASEQKKVKYVTKKPGKKTQQQQQQKQENENSSSTALESKSDDKVMADTVDGDVTPVVQVAEAESEEDLPDSWDIDDDAKEINQDNKDAAAIPAAASPSEKAEVSVEKTQHITPTTKSETDKESSSDSDSGSSDDSDSDASDDESDSSSNAESEKERGGKSRTLAEKPKESVRDRIERRRREAERNRTQDRLRAPVICVLGHVDTGKTKILDKIRHTNVQDGEAGGITQQIGATMVPLDAIQVQTRMVKEFQSFDLRLPGLLIIDTPGHESFSNLRSRGSNLCDMAILVIDIMHGLEPQTIESINLLRKKHTPFVVALNKVDRLFEWKRSPGTQIEDTVRKQKKNTKMEFEERVQIVVNELAEQGLNSALFYKNTNEKMYISLVPTSAHSGDGMGDLMAMICKLTQTRLAEKLAYSAALQSTIMEVKSLPGLGTTVDVILVNGTLREGDTIITGGIEGPIVTQIRSVLTPQPMRELRVKSQYIQHKAIDAAQGVKLCAKDMERAIAGSPLFVAEQPDEIEFFKREVAEITSQSLSAIKVSERGVYVQASTLGSLEALLEFLKTSKISYCGVNIGPVHKRDIMRASVMLEHNPMYAAVLAFDVKVERDAQEIADKEGVKIFTADIIYHLFDKFTAFTEDYRQKKRDEFKHIAMFPCKLRVLPQHIYNSRDPIVIGVHIEAGSVRLGTVITVPSKEFCDIGVVTGIEGNHKQLEKSMAGQEVSLKIEAAGEAPRMYGRHFTHEDMLMSKVTRESIDALKNYFREEMSKQDWQLLIELKKIFEIM